ncbi:MAG: type II/IV secretion system ATPase subunit [Candidatus Micrarchaeota archaeon]|nr:type II/IV secretion system ATPase subunit [Candidatus Micrarchaeota archaeon]
MAQQNGKKGNNGAVQPLETYQLSVEGMAMEVQIARRPDLYVPYYSIKIPGLAEGTRLILDTQIRGELVGEVNIDISEMLDAQKSKYVRDQFFSKTSKVLLRHFPTLPPENMKILSAYLMQYTLGLGDLEPFLHDENLEEIVVNCAGQPIWVFHKKYGWCITNVTLKDEKAVQDYAAAIGRRVGRQINLLNPLMDARLSTGDRVNATLFPISTNGNTITIRKFARNPWTPTMFVQSSTISAEVMALLWLSIQNEMSILVSGGTGSGKTSFLNALSSLFPPNQRIISIEDTREIYLPSFLQWVPLSTRLPNPEGKGEVKMLDLLVNSLRMRPDRIIVGEVRRKREAEILFEAMHTGHSVIATLHADNADQTISRLTNPPVDIPQSMLSALDLIVVQYRNRRTGLRRTFEVAEVDDRGRHKVIYRWNPRNDRIDKVDEISALADRLSLYTGMTQKEISADIAEKSKVINYMIKQGCVDVEHVGRVVAEYYNAKESLLDAVEKGVPLKDMIG